MCPSSDESPSYVLQLENGEIPIFRLGHGPQLLIALHGFERHGNAFSSWENALGSSYTICAPQLPFHGDSKWNKSAFNQDDILELIRAIIKKEDANSITLCGFSLGARISICLAPALKNEVKQFILLAPAGIGSYDKVPPIFIQNTIEFLLRWPWWFKLGTKLLYKIGWISHFQKRYAEVQIFPADRRTRLFRIYNSAIHFQPSTPSFVNFWHTKAPSSLVVLGKRDRVVPNDKIRTYFDKIPQCTIIEIDAKHELETKEVAELIRDQIGR